MELKILFVDDEVNILEGLKRTFKKKDNEWKMFFVESLWLKIKGVKNE